MKDLDLKMYEVQEMNKTQMEDVDGGFWQFVVAAIVGGMIYDLVNNTGECIDAMSKGYNDATSKS